MNKLIKFVSVIICIIYVTTFNYGGCGGSKGGGGGTSSGSSAPVSINAPSNLVTNAVSSSRIDLTWIDNATNEEGFEIERKTGAGDTYEKIKTVSVNVTSYSDTGLSAATTYYYRIRAYNAAGHSNYSNDAFSTTEANWTPTLTKIWGGNNTDYTTDVAVDSSGNIYMTGWTYSFGPGNGDIFLLKYDPNGTLLWQRACGGSSDFEGAYSIALDPSSMYIYVAGSTRSYGAGGADVLLQKYDSSGNLVWGRTWGGTDTDKATSIAVDEFGNIYVAGSTNSFGAGLSDAFLLKFDSAGSLLWQTIWGGNGYDSATGINIDSPYFIYVTGYTDSFGAGSDDAFLLKYTFSGTLLWQKTWGGNEWDVAYSTAVEPSSVTPLASITAIPHAGFALGPDGTIWQWNQIAYQILGLTSITRIASGANFMLALRADGTVWAWGTNSFGQLGDATTTTRTAPVQVKGPGGVGFLVGITTIAAGSAHSIALKNDGTVWTWGYNGSGQLGDVTTTTRTAPVQVSGLTNVTAVDSGGWYTIALKNDGTVWTWGYNGSGQLGDATTTTRTAPVQASGLTNVTAIARGGYYDYAYTVALKNDGTVWTWGYNSFYGQLGNGTTTSRSTPGYVRDASGITLTGITTIAAGTHHSIALKNDGTVWAWGWNSSGELGDGSTTTRSTSVQVKGTDGIGFLTGITAIAVGSSHSIALKNDGTVWTWGNNGSGQLGDVTTTTRTAPVQVKGPGGVGFLVGITTIAAGSAHSIALKNDGTVWTWGYNEYGELGNGMNFNSSMPTQVIITKTPETIYVCGSTTSYGAGHDNDGFLLKYNDSGTLLWQRTWGGNESDIAYSVAVDPSTGNIYVTGQTSSFGSGYSNPFILKYDSSGTLLWQKIWNGMAWDMGISLVVGASNIYLAGTTYSYVGQGENVSGLINTPNGTITTPNGTKTTPVGTTGTTTGAVTTPSGLETGAGGADVLLLGITK